MLQKYEKGNLRIRNLGPWIGPEIEKKFCGDKNKLKKKLKVIVHK